MKKKLAKNPHKKHIALGDFNLYHELWGGLDVSKTHIEKSEELLIAMQRWEMEQMIPTGTATYKESTGESIIDLIFATTLLSESLIFCGIAEEFDYDSDHQSILLQWTLQTIDKPQDSRRLLSKIDNSAIIKTLKGGLANISLFSSKILDKLDEKLISLINTINKAIDASTPRARLCPRSVPGLNKKCKDAQMRARRLKKIWKKEGTEES